MGRTKGSTTKKKCWKIRVVQGDTELHNQDYTTLQEASKDLGMTYCQLFELAPNGRNKKVKKHKYAPQIIVEKIPKNNNTLDFSEIPEISEIAEIPLIPQI